MKKFNLKSLAGLVTDKTKDQVINLSIRAACLATFGANEVLRSLIELQGKDPDKKPDTKIDSMYRELQSIFGPTYKSEGIGDSNVASIIGNLRDPAKKRAISMFTQGNCGMIHRKNQNINKATNAVHEVIDNTPAFTNLKDNVTDATKETITEIPEVKLTPTTIEIQQRADQLLGNKPITVTGTEENKFPVAALDSHWPYLKSVDLNAFTASYPSMKDAYMLATPVKTSNYFNFSDPKDIESLKGLLGVIVAPSSVSTKTQSEIGTQLSLRSAIEQLLKYADIL